MAKSTVAVRFTGDVAALKKSIGDAEGKLGQFGSKVGAFAKKVAVGLGAVAVAGVAVGKQLVDSASDLQETLSKSNTIFGDNAKAIEKWAAGGAKAFGQSKTQALDAASTFGNMFTQLGIGTDKAADMSMAMTELASDFASFHNADITEVLQAQQAAFRGEYDAVQRFVPTINAASVEQKALAMGLAGTSKELTAQDKALATQALLMEGAGAAAGDFARTSDGLANKQRILSANFENLQAKIGTALIPVMTALTDFAITRLVPGLQMLGEWLGVHLPPLIETGRAALQVITDWVVANWPTIQATVQSVMDAVMSVITNVTSTISSLWQAWGDNILNFATQAWDAIRQQIEGALQIIQGVIQTVTSLIKGDWEGVWNGIKQIVEGVWQAINGIIDQALAVAKLAIGAAWDAVKGLTSGAWEAVKGAVSSAWEGIKSLVSGGVDAILGFIGSIPGRVASVARGMFDSVVSSFKGAINGIIRGWNNLSFTFPSVGGDWNGPLPGGDFKIGGWKVSSPNLPLLAKGTDWFKGGMAVVGEDGPELVRLPRGSAVYSHRRSMQMADSLASPQIVENHITLTLDGEVVARVVNRVNDRRSRAGRAGLAVS